MLETTYQVQYEICSLIFLCVLSIHFFSSRRFPSTTNSMFSLVLLSSIADVTLDIITAYTIHYAAEVPIWVNYGANMLFFSFQVFIPLLLSVYVVYAAKRSFLENKGFFLGILPGVLFCLLLYTTPWNGLVFSMRDAAGSIAYTRGPLVILSYLVALSYILYTFALLVAFRKSLSNTEKWTIVSFELVIIFVVVVMLFKPDLLLTGLAISISAMSMMFTLQNPDDMLDMASGAYNYNALMSFLDTAVQNRRPLYALVMEIGGIDTVNRSMDLHTGNGLLFTIGEYFTSMFHRPWFFRASGSRFVLFARDEAEMTSVAENLERRFRKPWKYEQAYYDLSITARYFTVPVYFESASEYLDFLRSTFEENNARGTVKPLQIDDGYLDRIRRHAALREALQTALRTGEGLELHFQPICRGEDGFLVAAEELLRFEDPVLGRIPPDEFVPVAEQAGFAPQLDAFVLKESCSFLNRHPELKLLDINLSGAEFFHDPTEEIIAIVNESGVEPSRIRFEITETAAAMYPHILKRCMLKLIARGFSFAMDDFGTGYCNLTQALKLPFSVVKVDRSLLGETEHEKRLLHVILHFFQEMGVATVVEGVETMEQLARVRMDGGSFVQGYYYQRPLPEREFEEYLSKSLPDGETKE